jgi:hypothetical protein
MVRQLSLSEKLHLVIPVYAADGETVTAYVHSAPISREVFEAHFMLLAKTFAAIHASGLGIVAGPRVASLLLSRTAEEQRDELGALALMNEIRRLTNVSLRTPQGWDALPFQHVADQGMLDAEDLAEVTNAIVFFIVTSSMQRKTDRKMMMDGAARLWGAQTSSLDFTAFVASQRISTIPAPTVKVPESSGPY